MPPKKARPARSGMSATGQGCSAEPVSHSTILRLLPDGAHNAILSKIRGEPPTIIASFRAQSGRVVGEFMTGAAEWRRVRQALGAGPGDGVAGALGRRCVVVVEVGKLSSVLPRPEMAVVDDLPSASRETLAAMALMAGALDRPTWQNARLRYGLTTAGVRRAQRLAAKWGRIQ